MSNTRRVDDLLRLAWVRWTRWRRSRPFWAGLFALGGGLTILLLPAGQLTVFTLPGTAGFAGFLIGGLITIFGLLFWFDPGRHTFIAVLIMLLALASFVYTNLGGFLLGMLLSLIAGSLGFAWTPGQPPPHPAETGELQGNSPSRGK